VVKREAENSKNLAANADMDSRRKDIADKM
jgi:hypothetical protein